MAIVKATVKGQIVIPADIRRKYRIVKGTRLNIYEQGNKIVAEPLQDDPIQQGRGMLKTGGRILKALVADRKREAKL
jgi:AbrB family looped-hinge helix DNA binding protein